MTENDKLDLILSEIQGMKQDISSMKQDISNLNQAVKNVEQKTTNLSLHIENSTDKNIQLIAENYIELTKKLNQAIPVADKNLAYEVKVNYLIEEVADLKHQVAELKSKIA